MKQTLPREAAVALLKQYNKDAFHLRHAYTVEGVMRWYANELGYGEEADFWAQAGLLHDIDFEMYPEQHCIKARDIEQAQGIRPVLRSRHGEAVCFHACPQRLCQRFIRFCNQNPCLHRAHSFVPYTFRRSAFCYIV